jgi:phosphoribosylamine---glycine ligase
MKALIVGGGGREHAIAWSLARRHPAIELISAPGNPGLARLGRCAPVPISDIPALVELAHRERPSLTIVGPEAPLADGIVDAFRANGLPIFGPTKAAARIESSKAFAKQLMLDAGVPTARAERHSTLDGALHAVRTLGTPVVIKASGLAAGKGVIVCATADDADRAVVAMLTERSFGDAGAEILVEEFMEGEELSLFALTDGTTAIPMLAAQDHKRLLDGDRGPNTGGMGSYAPVSLGTPSLVSEVMERIIAPTLAALRVRGTPFTGLLYAGLMVTELGPRVVEFNARFGDPETETLLPLLESDLLAPLLTIARGESLQGGALDWSDGHAVTTVVAAAGYPDAPRKGARITLPPPTPGVTIFHAGTAIDASGALAVSGGRVFAVTATANTLAAAQHASASAAAAIEFEGRQFRGDIGWRDLRRNARASRD